MTLEAQTVTNLLLLALLVVMLAALVAVATVAARRVRSRRAGAYTPGTPRQYRQSTADEVDAMRARLDVEPPVALSQGDRAAFRDYTDTDADGIREAREKAERDVDRPDPL